MSETRVHASLALAAGLAALGLATACARLDLPETPPPRLFTLAGPAASPGATAAPAAPPILVSEPVALPGFDTPAMRYSERAHELAAFRGSQWADTPSRMLAPLLVRALEGTGRFGAVMPSPAGVAAGLRLDTELELLLHDFTVRPSRVRLALRARLVDTAARRVVATREFEAAEEAPTDDAYGGVQAANRALAGVLADLAAWCGEAAGATGR